MLVFQVKSWRDEQWTRRIFIIIIPWWTSGKKYLCVSILIRRNLIENKTIIISLTVKPPVYHQEPPPHEEENSYTMSVERNSSTWRPFRTFISTPLKLRLRKGLVVHQLKGNKSTDDDFFSLYFNGLIRKKVSFRQRLTGLARCKLNSRNDVGEQPPFLWSSLLAAKPSGWFLFIFCSLKCHKSG